MKGIGQLVALIFGLLLIAKSIVWMLGSVINPSPEAIEKGGELIADAAVPWWIGVMGWLEALPFAGFLILGFILFLVWSGAVRSQ